jgi:hypothetical protein
LVKVKRPFVPYFKDKTVKQYSISSIYFALWSVAMHVVRYTSLKTIIHTLIHCYSPPRFLQHTKLTPSIPTPSLFAFRWLTYLKLDVAKPFAKVCFAITDDSNVIYFATVLKMTPYLFLLNTWKVQEQFNNNNNSNLKMIFELFLYEISYILSNYIQHEMHKVINNCKMI